MRYPRMTTVAVFVLGLATLLAPRRAAAQATDFRWTTGGQSAFDVPAAGTLDVPLYLQSITPAGASLLANENGLFSAGLSVRRSDAGAGTGATITGITANRALFDDADPTSRTEQVVGPTLARLKEERLAANGSGSEVVGADRRVLVGTVTIAGGDVDNLSTFQIRDFVNTMDQISTAEETLTGEGTTIDPRIAVGSFTVTSVPEPSSAFVLLAAGAALAVRRRRRAKN